LQEIHRVKAKFQIKMETINNLLKGDLLKSSTIIELLKIFFATSALVTALFTLYLKDARLRASSENILVTLIFFLISTIFTFISLLIVNFNTGCKSALLWAFILNSLALVIYIFTLFSLLFSVFLRSYNQIYNLRTNKVWRYFKPVKYVYNFFRGYKSYELEIIPRTLDANSFKCIRGHFKEHEIQLISRGASILITGEQTKESVDLVLELIHERLMAKETANYISADHHPYEIWERFKNKYSDYGQLVEDIVFIDAFSPSFGFTDDIYENYTKKLKAEGVGSVKAKTFAGLHTMVTKAFNLIKKNEKKRGKKTRRPMTIIYSHTSALCDFESMEQFRIFWRHVISSERIYGMTLLILEDNLCGDEILNTIRQNVDFILSYEKEGETLKLTKTK
jgi:hypothetical protein